ncbi:hypothetical protein JOE38_001426 [Clavibacter michiganensis]|nr:hypothetical protein [Clavibacter michiganensis]
MPLLDPRRLPELSPAAADPGVAAHVSAGADAPAVR